MTDKIIYLTPGDTLSVSVWEEGTTVLLKGGAVYPKLFLDGACHAAVGCIDPVPAILDGGMQLDNCEDVLVFGLVLRGQGWKSEPASGLFINACERVTARNLEIFGFSESGVEIRQSRDVLVEGCYAHNNGFCGIATSLSENHNEHIRIRYCKAYDNGGAHAIADNHSGSGIAIFYAKDVVVEYCEAAGNGWAQRQKNINGPVGIWCACDVDGVVFRKCIARHNRTQPGGVDGDGFDIDGGVKNGWMEDNYSYENEGSGYLFCEYGSGVFYESNHMRRCISLGDASRVLQQGSVQYYGPEGIPMSDSHSTACLLVPSDGKPCVVNQEMGSMCTDISLTHSVLVPSDAPAVTCADSRRAVVSDNAVLTDPAVRRKLLDGICRLTDPRRLDDAPVFAYLADGSLAQRLMAEETLELFGAQTPVQPIREKLEFCYRLNERDFEGSRLSAESPEDAQLCYDSVGPGYALRMKNGARVEFEYPSWKTEAVHLAVLTARLQSPTARAWLFVAEDGRIVDAAAVGGTVGSYVSVPLRFTGFSGTPTIGVLAGQGDAYVYLQNIEVYRVISDRQYHNQAGECRFGDVYDENGATILSGEGSRVWNRAYIHGPTTIAACVTSGTGLLFVRDSAGERALTLSERQPEGKLSFQADGFVEYGVVNTGSGSLSVRINHSTEQK